MIKLSLMLHLCLPCSPTTGSECLKARVSTESSVSPGPARPATVSDRLKMFRDRRPRHHRSHKGRQLHQSSKVANQGEIMEEPGPKSTKKLSRTGCELWGSEAGGKAAYLWYMFLCVDNTVPVCWTMYDNVLDSSVAFWSHLYWLIVLFSECHILLNVICILLGGFLTSWLTV